MWAAYLLLFVATLKAASIYFRRRASAQRELKRGNAAVENKGSAYVVLQEGQGVAPAAKRVVVTGGQGFLGRHVIDALLEEYGERIHIVLFDLCAKAHNDARVTCVKGDLRVATHIRQVIAGADLVMHVAGLIPAAGTTRSQLMRVNFECTRELVEACLDLDVRGLVYTSSVAVTLPKDPAPVMGVLESVPTPAECQSVYGDSKRLAERVVLGADCHVLQTIALRPGGIYGLGDKMMVDDLLRGTSFIGKGVSYVPFVWVKDCARAHVLAARALLTKPAVSGLSGRAYHICHDPVTDLFTYRTLSGGAPLPGEPAEPNAWVGRKYTPSTPLWLIWVLCAINEATVHFFGWASISPYLHRANVEVVVRNHSCDITQARHRLGWEPTRFREAARQIMAEYELLGSAARKNK